MESGWLSLPTNFKSVPRSWCGSISRRSDPQVVREILADTDAESGAVLYAGDSGVDMDTARAAGVRSVGVTWGFRARAELYEHGADHVVDRPGEILELL